MAIERLDPNSDGSNVAWDPTPATADEYTRCNDGSDTTYCSTSTSFELQRFGVDNTFDSSGQTINHVDQVIRAKSTTNNDDIRFACLSGGTTYYSIDEPIGNAAAAEYSYEWTNNPADSAAWESADVDAAEFGAQSRSITGEMFMYQLWVNVDYTGGALVGYAFGEESPTDETAESWATWSDGSAGSPTIVGDADWGQLELGESDIGHSAVKDLGSIKTRVIVLKRDKYGSSGSGEGKIYIRGQSTTFTQDAASPSWEEYTTPVKKDWRFIQAKLEYST